MNYELGVLPTLRFSFTAEMVLSKVLVIDGGFATQLTVHVGKSVDGDPLWSAR